MKPRRAIVILATTAACAIPASAAAASGGPNSIAISRNHYEYTPHASATARAEYNLRKATVTHAGNTLTFRWYVAKLSRVLTRPCLEFDFSTTNGSHPGHATALIACYGRHIFRNSYVPSDTVRNRSIKGVGHISSNYSSNYVQWSGLPASLWPKGEREINGWAFIQSQNNTKFGHVGSRTSFIPRR